MVSRHRHIVALPMIGVLMGLSFWSAGSGDDFMGTLLSPDGGLRGGEGVHIYATLDYTITFLSGFFFVQASEGNLSVAALTSPVLIRAFSETILVPVGWQWRTSEGLSQIPGHFLATSLKEIPVFSSVTVPTTYATVDEWLLASLHPMTRDQVWVMEEPEGVEIEDERVRLMGFLRSDTLSKAASSFTVERWGIAIRAFLKGSPDPAVFLNQLIPQIGDVIWWFIENGYPERDRRYRELMEDIAKEFRVFVSEDSKGILERLRSAGFVVRDAEEFPVISDETISEPIPFDAGTVKQQAYILLRDMGALFTIHTEIVPQSLVSVDVHGIVFGNHTFDLVLKMDQQMVDGISMDGVLMAYPMGVEEFRDWLVDLE